MADIAVQPIILQDVDLILGVGTDDYAAACSSAILTPNTPIVSWKGLKRGTAFSAAGTTTWTLDLTYAQDHAAAARLAGYLYAHRGEVVPMSFKTDPTHATWNADVMVAAGAIGGAVDVVPESTVSLPVTSEPEPTYPV